jgi:hypothetical protein
VELDPNFYSGYVRTCHAKGDDVGCSALDRIFDNALKEIRNWLNQHPQEVLILRFENYVDGTSATERAAFLAALNTRLGGLVFPHNNMHGQVNRPWPSIQDLLAMGKRVVIFDYYSPEMSPLLWPNPVVEQGASEFFQPTNPQHVCQDYFRLSRDPDQEIEVELRGITGLPDGLYRVEYEFDDRPASTDDEGIVYHILNASGDRTGQTLGVKNRDFSAFHEVIRVTESRPFLESFGGIPEFEVQVFLDEAKVEQLAACRVTLLSMDFLHAKEETSEDACDSAELPLRECRSPDRRLERAVWSWRPGDRGHLGDAAVFRPVHQGRWVSAPVGDQYHFACARPREGVPTTWADPDGANWQITAGVGPWSAGGQQCLEEFGEEYVFAVPRIGWQNARLREANLHAYDIWLNYNDIKHEGVWVVNKRPTAQGAVVPTQPIPLYEGEEIALTSAGSFDPEGDALSFSWTFGDGETGVGPTTGPFPTHIYGDNADFEAIVNADDGFAGVDILRFTVQILNADPVAQIDRVTDETGAVIGVDVPVALVGLSLTVYGSFSDAGWLDTHTASVDWDDGTGDGLVPVTDTTVSVGVAVTGTTSFRHVFGAASDYTVTLTITDDDAGFDAPTHAIQVVDTTGAIEIILDQLSTIDGAARALARLDNALDKGLKNNLNAELEMLQKAVQEIEVLEASSGLNLESTKGLLILAAKSDVVETVQRAEAEARGAQDLQKIQSAKTLLAQGDQLLAQKMYVAAAGAYLQAGRQVLPWAK